MNSFNNNAPKISASEHLRNKRTKALYKSNKKKYRKSQYNGGISFNSSGNIKNVSNYQTKRDIAQGYYLANCNKDCCNIDLQTIKINTGPNSIYNKFDGSGCSKDCSSGFTVLSSFEYCSLIDLTTNNFASPDMEKNYIIIDPSNNLFSVNGCKNKYLDYTSYDDESEKCNKSTLQNYMQHLYRNSIGNIKM